MNDLRTSLDSIREQLAPQDSEVGWAQLDDLRRRRAIHRRVRAGLVAGAVAVAAASFLFVAFNRDVSQPVVTPQPSPDPRVSGSIQVGPTGQTTALVAGFGDLWVTAYGVEGGSGVDRAALLRVDPQTMTIIDTIPVPTVPTWETGGGGLLATTDSIWLAGSTGAPQKAQLVQVDPVSGDATMFSSDTMNGFMDVTTDGHMIYALGESGRGVGVLRLDPATGQFSDPVYLAGDTGRQIAAVPDAIIVEELSWQGDEGPCASLASIDPATMTVRAEDPGPVCDTAPVDLGRLFTWQGRVWTTTADRFAAVDSATALPTGGPTMFDADAAPQSTVVVDGDSVWFVSGKSLARLMLSDGDLQRFDTRIGWSSVAMIDESLWALDWDGTLTRVDLFRNPPTPSASLGLRVGDTQDVDAWHVLATNSGVYAGGANEMIRVDPGTATARPFATGPWDYDYMDLAASGNQVAIVSGLSIRTYLADGPRLTDAQFDPGVGSLLHVAIDGRWLWVSTVNGFLARLDPETGEIDYGMPANTGPLVVGSDYLVVGDLRVNKETFAFHRLPLWARDAADAAFVGEHLWLAGDGWLRCVDIDTLDLCGELAVPGAAALAASGDRLFVLTATGSTDPDRYEPDPEQPATVILIDGDSGRRLASPVALPGITPATISAWNDHAWVGFHDTGRVTRLDVLAG
jgi:hypothetical protein